MSEALIQALLAMAPLLPLMLAVATVHDDLRETVARLLPYAPLPALAVALLANFGITVELEYLLLGLHLGLDGPRRLLLLMTALIWMAAGFYGRRYIAQDRRQHLYNSFFLATMGGNLGLIVALDAAAFYLFFSLMTLSSYILVVFEGNRRAYRAGRIYLVLSLLGEMALLYGLLRAVHTSGSLMIAEIPEALVEGEIWTNLLLFFGFAIKAGQFPLHIWLPLAHPAAPTPASAVLSGAMIKAGLLGMVLFLPLGEAANPGTGLLISILGLTTAFYGAVCGIPQRNPKTVLAYSSLSQMGVMVAALGPLLATPGTETQLLPAILVYAVHHGLSKAGLFLSVGVMQQERRRQALVLLASAVAAIAIAGAPITAGSLTKYLVKSGVAEGQGASADLVGSLLSWTAVGTFLLMLRFLLLLKREGRGRDHAAASAWLWIPFLVIIAASQLLPWSLARLEGVGSGLLSLSNIWGSLWPILLALGLTALWHLARKSGFRWDREVPEGDIVHFLPSQRAVTLRTRLVYRRLGRSLRRRPELLLDANDAIGARIAGLEAVLLRPGAAGLVVLLAAVVMVISVL